MAAEPVQTHHTYGRDVTTASRSVLIEVAEALKAYRDALVLVGGWVPALLLERHQSPEVAFHHVGSADIDLLIDPARLPEDRYATIAELLQDRGYTRSERSVFTFQRAVPGLRDPIGVDFLVPSPPAGEGRRRETPEVQPTLRARNVDGAGVALRHQVAWSLEGEIPEGGRVTAGFQMADLTGILAMKGLAFGMRLKGRGKDAYDIWSLCRYYGQGAGEVGAAVRASLSDVSVREGLAAIRERFSAVDALGPSEVARFLAGAIPEGIADPRMAAFQDVRAMLEAAEA